MVHGLTCHVNLSSLYQILPSFATIGSSVANHTYHIWFYGTSLGALLQQNWRGHSIKCSFANMFL
jgi:hypothetical protein